MKGMEKLLEKKKKDGKELSGVEKDAKMSVIGHLRDLASSAMGDKLKSLNKVSVASDSDEGLKHGLAKAQEIVAGGHGGMQHMVDDAEDGEDRGNDLFSGGETPEHESEDTPHAEGSEEEESEESPEEEASEEEPEDHDELSEDEIDQKLKELMAKKKRLSMK